MNALQSPPPMRSPRPPRQRVSRAVVRRPSQHRHQAIAIETGAKLTVNVLLAIAAIAALVKLIPYTLSQQQKMQELQSKVTALEVRVDALETEFDRYFDPQQTQSVMQEQSNRVGINQLQIIWTNQPEN